MSRKSPPAATTLPQDLEPLYYLHAQFCESKQVRASIESALRDDGRLIAGPDGKDLLVSRADYIGALGEFCQRVGVTPEAVNPKRSRARFDVNAQMRQQQDERREQQLAAMGFNPNGGRK